MKIIFVIGSGKLGGAERQAFLTARYFKEQKNYEVAIVTLSEPDGPVKKMCASAGIDYYFFPFNRFARTLYFYQLIFIIRPFFRKLCPDVLISYTDNPNILCGTIWKGTRAKLYIWSQRHSHTFPYDRTVMERALYNTPIVVSNSQAGIDNLKADYPKATRHITFYLIHNGIQLAPPRFDRLLWRQKTGTGASTFIALMIANLSYEYGKDHTTLLHAWKYFIEKAGGNKADVMLLLAGRFETKTNDLLKLSMDLEIFGKVRFLGAVEDITGLAQSADLLVHSAKLEGMPNAVLEGMACGLPVVATDIPGIREILGEENSSYLVEPGDSTVLAEKIYHFYVQPDLRITVGQLNKKRITMHFSVEKMGEAYNAIICRHAVTS